MSPKLLLLDLPSEIIREILSWMDIGCLLGCSKTCKTIHRITSSSSELQYKIELFACGMRDSPSSSQTSRERLDRLLLYRENWKKLALRRRKSYSLSQACHAYDYVSGIFTKCGVPDGAVAYHTGGRVYTFTNVRLPAISTRTVDLCIQTKDFAQDPSQDLFIFLEMFDQTSIASQVGLIQIHIRTFSAPHTPHPDAALQALEATYGSRIETCLLEIAEDAIGLFVAQPKPSVFIWNWRTGQMLAALQEHKLERQASDFSFITPRSFVVVAAREDAPIVLYTIPSSPGHVPAKTATALQLPPLETDMTVVSASVTTGPWVARPPSDPPFGIDNDLRIYVFELALQNRLTHVQRRAAFVVRGQDLQRFIKNSLSQDAVRVVEWQDWIPQIATFIHIGRSFSFLRYVHGQRVIYHDLILRTVCLLDFGVPRGALGLGQRLVHASTRSTVKGLFKIEIGSIPSGLPYTCIPVKLAEAGFGFGDYAGIFLDEARLVTIKSIYREDGTVSDKLTVLDVDYSPEVEAA